MLWFIGKLIKFSCNFRTIIWITKYPLEELILTVFSTLELARCDDVEIYVPKYGRKNGAATLSCLYDSDSFYSVTWLREFVEIYKYTPSENPPIKLFPNEYVHVNVSLKLEMCQWNRNKMLLVSARNPCQHRQQISQQLLWIHPTQQTMHAKCCFALKTPEILLPLHMEKWPSLVMSTTVMRQTF